MTIVFYSLEEAQDCLMALQARMRRAYLKSYDKEWHVECSD